jgi:O-antigen/teichoic acid export membrane protein
VTEESSETPSSAKDGGAETPSSAKDGGAETPSSAATPVATGLRDGLAMFVSKLVAALLAIVALKAVQTITDNREYGRYATFLLVSNFAIAFTSWPTASVLRLGSNEWSTAKTLARTFGLHVLLVLGSAILLAAPLWQAHEVVDRYIEVSNATWFVFGYALVTAFANVTAAILKPANRVAQFALLPLVTRILWVSVLGWYAVKKSSLDAHDVMLVCLATALPQLGAGLLLVLRFVFPPARPHYHDADTAVRFGIPVMFRQLGTQSFAYVNLVMIRSYGGIVAMGWFNVASALAEQTALLAVAFEDLMGPILAHAAADGDERRLRTYYRKVAPQIALVWSTACGAALVLAKPIVAALSAKNPVATGAALQVLMLATAVRIVVTLEAPVFDAHLISVWPSVFFGLGFATNLGLDLVLVPRYGIEGAAWASVAGWTLNAILRSGYLGLRFHLLSPVIILHVLPVAAAFAYARTLGGSLLQDLGAVLAFAALAGLAGKLSGAFSPESLEALGGVRMPGRLRALLAWFYGARS